MNFVLALKIVQESIFITLWQGFFCLTLNHIQNYELLRIALRSALSSED